LQVDLADQGARDLVRQCSGARNAIEFVALRPERGETQSALDLIDPPCETGVLARLLARFDALSAISARVLLLPASTRRR
jgi:hypothetical protein